MRDAALTYTVAQGSRPGTTILKLDGPLTLVNILSFQQSLREIRPPVLIVDMSGVHYMDSAGLGLIMNGYVSAESHGNKFLLAGVNDRVAALFETTRVDRILSTHPSVVAAEAAIQPGASPSRPPSASD